jgi:hypothetical protein
MVTTRARRWTRAGDGAAGVVTLGELTGGPARRQLEHVLTDAVEVPTSSIAWSSKVGS